MNDEEPPNADKTMQPIYNLTTIQQFNLGQKPIIWQDVCRKLHENNRNWTGGAPKCLLDPPMELIQQG